MEIHSFDMKPIDPLTQEDEDEDDLNGLVDEKTPREIGEFIKHEDFNVEAMMQEPEEVREQYNNLSEIE
jgi:hypothetical protein